MTDDLDSEMASALDTKRGDDLLETLSTIDAERETAADPIYPDESALGMDVAEARALSARFRAVRDAYLGREVVDRAELPDTPGRVAAAIVVAIEADASELKGAALKAAQRASAEDIVDLQSFRTTEEVDRIMGRATDGERDAALERAATARAAAITMIRDDPTVLGSLNAIRDLEIRIGDARTALDAVNRYRETQALGFLGIFIAIPVVIGIAIVVIIIVGSR